MPNVVDFFFFTSKSMQYNKIKELFFFSPLQTITVHLTTFISVKENNMRQLDAHHLMKVCTNVYLKIKQISVLGLLFLFFLKRCLMKYAVCKLCRTSVLCGFVASGIL